jgi:hypothetical protein
MSRTADRAAPRPGSRTNTSAAPAAVPAPADAPHLELAADGALRPGRSPAGADDTAGLPPAALERVLATYRAIQAAEADVDEVLRRTVEHARAILGADLACVWRPAGGRTPRGGSVVASSGHLVEPWAAEASPDETGIGAACVAHGRPVLAPDYAAYVAGAAPPVTPFLVRSEGLRAVLCLPLREDDGEAVGVLHVGRRSGAGFSPSDVRLASALAGQAALALQNERLRRRVRRQHELAEHAAAVTARLARAADDGGAEGVRRALQREVGRRVDLARAPAGEEPSGALAVSVVAGRVHHGDLLVFGRPLNDADRITVERAATFVARELAREESAGHARLRSGSQLLGSLLDGAPPEAPHIVERAGHIGFDLTRPTTVLAVAGGTGDRAALHAAALADPGLGAGDVLLADGPSCVLVAVATPDGWPPHALLRAVTAADPTHRTGVSGPWGTVAAARDEALACLALAAEAPDRDAVLAADLGPLGALLGTPDLVGLLRRHVRTELGPLHEAERRGGAPLLAALDAHLACGRRLGTTAEHLGVHPSTLKYRLARIRDLIGVVDGRRAVGLWLALRAADLLASLGHPPFPAEEAATAR